MEIQWSFLLLYIIQNVLLSHESISGNMRTKNYGTDKRKIRIIGGKLTDIKYFPYVVSFVSKYSPKITKLHGAGIIIHKYWLVTSAHLMDVLTPYCNKGVLVVRSNTSTWRKNYVEHAIVKYYIHERFAKPISLDNDVAVVKVRNPFTAKYENQISIPEQYKYTVGTCATAVGWGSVIRDDFYNYTNHLRSVQVQLRSFRRCKREYKESVLHKTITKGMLCAAAPGKDVCAQDSGGPLVYKKWLIGIVSWGPKMGCADNILPGVYTRVALYRKWIYNKIEQYGRIKPHQG